MNEIIKNVPEDDKSTEIRDHKEIIEANKTMRANMEKRMRIYEENPENSFMTKEEIEKILEYVKVIEDLVE